MGVLPLPASAEDLGTSPASGLLFVSGFDICPHVEQEILLMVREIGPILAQLGLPLGMSQKKKKWSGPSTEE